MLGVLIAFVADPHHDTAVGANVKNIIIVRQYLCKYREFLFIREEHDCIVRRCYNVTPANRDFGGPEKSIIKNPYRL